MSTSGTFYVNTWQTFEDYLAGKASQILFEKTLRLYRKHLYVKKNLLGTVEASANFKRK